MRPIRHPGAEEVDRNIRRPVAGRGPSVGEPAATDHPEVVALRALQATAGNQAVSTLLGTHRAGANPALQRLADGVVVQRQGGTLRMGSRGRAVAEVQAALNQQAYGLAVDGIFGRGTEAAVRDYQATAGLSVDGIVGPRTRAALGLQPAGGAGAGLTHVVGEVLEHAAGAVGATGERAAGGRAQTRAPVLRGSSPVPATPGTRVGGSYDTGSGAGYGQVTTPFGEAHAGYAPNEERVYGGFTSASGRSRGAVGGNLETGTGSGFVTTPYGGASVELGEESIHGSAEIPGLGEYEFEVDRPDWL